VILSWNCQVGSMWTSVSNHERALVDIQEGSMGAIHRRFESRRQFTVSHSRRSATLRLQTAVRQAVHQHTARNPAALNPGTATEQRGSMPATMA
jgi:hypothetical protein